MFANQHFGMLLPPRPPPPSLPHNHIHPQNHRQEDQYQVSYKGGPPPSASAFVTTTVTLSATGIPDEPEGGGMDPEPEQRMVERSMEDDGKVIETVEMLGEEQTVVEPVQHGLEKRNVCPACPASAGVKNEYNGGPSRDSATGRPCCPARKVGLCLREGSCHRFQGLTANVGLAITSTRDHSFVQTLLKTKLVRRTTIRRVFKTRVVKSTTTVSITPPPFNITGSLIEEVDGVDGPAVEAPIEIQLVSQPNVTATGRLEKRFFRTIARARTNLFGAFVFSLPRLIPQTVIRIIASIDNSVIGTFIAGVDGMIPVNGFPGTVRKPARLPLLFETPGTYQWQAPFGVTSISVACVGGGAGGGGGNDTHAGAGGGGAGLGYDNNIFVIPGLELRTPFLVVNLFFPTL